ncbi:MAG: hypothetical protein AAF682_24960 [Planctomycetota bacterium]
MNATRLAALLVLAAGCGADDPHGPHAGGSAPPADGPKVRLDIPPTVRRNLGLTFATVEARRVEQTLRVPGAFELLPSARREYRMALPGRIELLVEQYERVEPGQPLFRFLSPAWPELLHEIVVGEQQMDAARAEIAAGEARLVEARTRVAALRGRQTTLAEADVKRADLDAELAEAEASLPRLEAELGIARTRYANATRTREHALHVAATASGFREAELEAPKVVDGEERPTYATIDWIEVFAAEAGVVERLWVTDGAFAEPPDAVLSTVDPERVRFRAFALQADLARLREADAARVVPPVRTAAAGGSGTAAADAVEATLTFGLEAHPEERTFALLATPAAPAPWIRPGVSAFLEVVLDPSAAQKLAVPRSCVVQDGLTHVFFRRDPRDPNVAIRVEADLGPSDGRWVVLESGVIRGDEVVLAGAYELKLASERDRSTTAGVHVHPDGTTHGDH